MWGNFLPFLTLNDRQESYDITSAIYVTSDPDRKFSESDIRERHTSGLRGNPARTSVLPLGVAGTPAWIVFTVDNQSWNDKWIMSFGQHMDGRMGTLHKVTLYLYDYDRRSKTKYLDNLQKNKSDFIAVDNEIDAHVSVTIEHGRKAMFVMYVEPLSGSAVTLVPKLIRADAYDAVTFGLFNKTRMVGIVFLLIAGLFLGAFVLERYYSCLAFFAYYIVQIVFLYYQNNIIYTDFQFSVQLIIILMACGPVIGLGTTKSLLYVGKLQSAQGRRITALVIGLFVVTVVGSFLIPQQVAVRGLFFYIMIAASYGLLSLLSLAQVYRGYTGALRFAVAWAVAVIGICMSILSALGVLPAIEFMVASYWYVLVLQGVLLASAVPSIILYDAQESQVDLQEEEDEKERLEQFRQSKESTEITRLRKLIEYERQVMNELREREVQQNEEMRKAKEAADEANRAKSAFLAVISHEIRTPMTGIMGMVRLLQDTTLSSNQREYAQTIQDSGDAMVSLLNDILDFEKIESGNLDLEYVDFDLHRLLNGIVTLMSGHATAKGITLKIDMGSDVPRFVVGDSVRLRQVLLNLAGNSIKFTSSGSVTLQARVEKSKESGFDSGAQQIYFGVKDTGIGISKEAQKNLFNPFAQADTSITRKFGGTGLGLAISQRLIDSMGGKIEIDSTEGEGSSFHFTLVLEKGHGAQEEKKGDDFAPAEKIQKSDEVLEILIVEDNEINQRLLKEFVDRMGHKVVLAGSGEDAMKAIGDQNFDMVLMDIELPGMSGMGTTKAIRALPDKKKAATPVIALSGNVRDEDVRACYAVNMNGHLSKPVDPKRLKQMIDKVIQGALDNPVVVEEEQKEEFTKVNRLDVINIVESSEKEEMKNSIVEQASLENDPDEDSFEVALNASEKQVSDDGSAQDDADVFDSTQLKGLRDSLSVVVFDDIVSSLLDKADEIVDAMQQGTDDLDLKTISARAHELKGMAGNYGLRELSATAEKIETAIKNGETEDIHASLKALPDVNHRARVAVEEWVG